MSLEEVHEVWESILEAGQAMRSGRTTSRQLVEECISAAGGRGAGLYAFARRFDNESREAARAADAELAAGLDRGPLHGIPVAVKDALAAREGPTTAGAALEHLAGFGGYDCAVVSRLRERGAILLGKTTMMEYSIGMPTAGEREVPANPWDRRHWAGGSSSGSASAVAAGLAYAAVGTDTAGSVRIPAAYCGVTGLKPTFGLIPTDGAVPLSWTCDTIGPIARTARDCVILLEAMSQATGAAHTTDGRWPLTDRSATMDHPLRGLVVGADQLTAHYPEMDRSVLHAMESFLTTLQESGATVERIHVPGYEAMVQCTMRSELWEGFQIHRKNLEDGVSPYRDSTRAVLSAGGELDFPKYCKIQKERDSWASQLRGLFQTYSAVVTPTTCGPAPLLAAECLDGLVEKVCTPAWNAIGFPAVSLPAGFSAGGLPIGVQVIGPPGEDSMVLAIGHAFQERTRWHHAHPAVTCVPDAENR